MGITRYGTAGQDSLVGTTTNDLLYGLDGHDTLNGLEGNDTLYGGAGNDLLRGDLGTLHFYGGTGNDTLTTGGMASMTAYFGRGDGQDTISPHQDWATTVNTLQFTGAITKSDIVVSVSGNSLVLSIRGTTDSVTIGGFYNVNPAGMEGSLIGGGMTGVQIVKFANGTSWTLDDLKAIVFSGTAGHDSIRGSIYQDTLLGGLGNDTLRGMEGDDWLDGGGGSNRLEGGAGHDTLMGSHNGDDVLLGGDGNDSLNGLLGSDTLYGGAGNDSLNGDEGALHFHGGTGNDTLSMGYLGSMTAYFARGDGQDTIVGHTDSSFSHTTLQFTGPITKADVDVRVSGLSLVLSIRGTTDSVTIDRFYNAGPGLPEGHNIGGKWSGVQLVKFADGTSWTMDDLKAIVFAGTSANDSLLGSFRDDTLTGGLGHDTLLGKGGNDWLDGGTGNDSMVGGTGNDTYLVDATGDTVVELGNDGTDTVRSSITYTLGNFVENLTLTGTASLNGTGNGLDNVLTGNEAANVLIGAYGNDTLQGLGGNDTLRGDQGTLHFHGGAGNDTLAMGDLGSMTAYFGRGDGQDTIVGHTDSSLSHTTLQFTGPITKADVDVRVSGLSLVLSIRGTTDSVTIDRFYNAGPGLPEGHNIGGKWSGVQLVKFADGTSWTMDDLKAIVFAGTSANDSLLGSFRDDTLTGGLGHDTLLGKGGNDWLDGGTGNDSMVGGTGNDTYLVDATGDTVVELGNDGTDTVRSSITYTLGANVENLTLTGTASLNGTGNGLANVLTGNEAANVLIGAYGNDTLHGLGGNDTLMGSADGDDVLYGGTGDDSLNGIQGSDTLYGGAGNDSLRGDMGALSFYGGAGNDTLMTGGMASMTAYFGRGDGQDVLVGHPDWAHGVNTLQFIGAIAKSDIAVSLSGNSLVLSIRGTTDSVTIDRFYNYGPPTPEGANIGGGMSGVQLVKFADGTSWTLDDLKAIVFAGTTGNDSINGTWQADTIFGGAGNDQLMGMGGNDRLDGGSGDDTLSSGSGLDTLIGGAGNDRYLLVSQVDSPFNDILDVIVETADGGIDTVVTPESYTLGAHLENLVVNGYAYTPADIASKVFTGTGNALANTLEGSDLRNVLNGLAGNDQLFGYGGQDVLDGGTGNDSMTGGKGDDTYVVDAAGDMVTELADEGTDLVQAGVHYILGANVENLTMVTTAALNGTGNLLNNVLTGNSAVNVLTGAGGHDTLYGLGGNDILYGSYSGNDALYGGDGNDALSSFYGNDTLHGGAGHDTLDGSWGNDTYQFGRGEGQDRIIESDNTTTGVDTLQLFAGVSREQVWWRKSGSDLEMSIIGTTDKVTIQNWYTGQASHVEQFRTADGKVLLDTKVNLLVNAMAAFAPPPVGQTTLTAAQQAALVPLIAANWK